MNVGARTRPPFVKGVDTASPDPEEPEGLLTQYLGDETEAHAALARADSSAEEQPAREGASGERRRPESGAGEFR